MANMPGGGGENIEASAKLAAAARARLEAEKKTNEAVRERIDLTKEERIIAEELAKTSKRAIAASRESRDVKLEALRLSAKISEFDKVGTALEKLKGVKANEALASQTAAFRVSKNQTSSMQGMAQEYERLDKLSRDSKATEVQKLEIGKQKANIEARYRKELELGATSKGRAALSRGEFSETSATSKLINTGSLAGRLAGKSDWLADIGEAEQAAMAGGASVGESMGVVAAAGAVGMEGLVSAMGAIAPALTTAASGVALFGGAFVALLQILDDGRLVSGKSMQALAMNSKNAWDDMGNNSFTTAGRIADFAGVSVASSALISSAFYEDLMPAAQAAMMTFNSWDRSSDNVDRFTGTLIKGAVEGADAGISFGDSMSMMVKASRSFGLSDAATLKTFETIKNGARASHLAVGDFNDVMGDSVEWGKRFGDQSGMYAQMATVLSSGKLGTAQRMMVGQGVAGLAMDPFRMMGLSAGASGSTTGAMSKLWMAAAEGGAGKRGVVGMAQDTLRDTFMQKRFGGGNMDVWQAISGGNIQDKTQAAMFASMQLTGSTKNYTAFAKQSFADDVKLMLKGDTKAADRVKSGLEDADAQTKGIKGIAQNTAGIKIIEGAVLGMFKTLVNMSMTMAFGGSTIEKRRQLADLEMLESKSNVSNSAEKE